MLQELLREAVPPEKVPFMKSIAVLAAISLLLAAAESRADEPKAKQISAAEAEFFEARVRPLLAENCFSCHGPAKQKSGLRLDSLQSLRKGGENGQTLSPGEPEASLLIKAIRYDGQIKMPPKGKLRPQAIEVLTTWVRMGAPWPQGKSLAADDVATQAWRKHWAFQPIRRPAVPTPHERKWPLTEVDQFILAKLESKGLKPSAPADRRTLIRRATFDLIGLPPSADEVAAFEADSSPDAYARLLDRLLASPHYGERWGRYWLDVARYADTKGYVFFQENDFPWSYTYRDYVIRAYNEDLPYDQFIVQQLAADRLPLGNDKRPLTALGFLTLGGRFMNNQQDILDDRIDVVTRGLMGLTVTCARCHDHKFDPIASKDYYSLYGVFASCDEPTVPPLFAPPPSTSAYLAFEKELHAREQKLTDFVRSKQTELVNSARTRIAEYMLAAHTLSSQPNTADFMLLADGGDLNPTMLHRWQTYLERTRKIRHPVFAPWHAYTALATKDFVEKAPARTAKFASSTDPTHRTNVLIAKALREKPPHSLTDVARCYAEVLNGIDKQWRAGLEKASKTNSPLPSALPDPPEEELRQVFYGGDSPTNIVMNPVGDLDLLPDRPSQAKLQDLRKAIESWRASGAGAPPRAMVLEDSPTPIEPHVFLRGNPGNPGPAVPRQFLAIVAGDQRRPFQHGSGRLELAQAIVDRNNPLTARVIVNRLWLHHFGSALVRTPSDFGMRSEPPTHPELLDYLAAQFMDEGWSIKKLHHTLMLSATYRQQSDDRPDCRRVDPENRLLWKMNRQRLDFEATRDALLASTGRLDPALGGPPVKDLAALTNNRRTVYGYIDRLNLPGLFRTFDFPNPDATSPQRDMTTVPQQALFLMNNPFALECARGVLKCGAIATAKDLEVRVTQLYRTLYGRQPAAEEIALARAFLGSEKDAAKAWERYVQGLMLANEFVFVD